MQPNASALAQKALADHARDPSLPPPANIDGKRLAVYQKLLLNNIRSFLDLCFTDSQTFINPEQWQQWQQRFLIEARPESPYFNDIAPTFLNYLHRLPEHDRPSAPILTMMDAETKLLRAEIAITPPSASHWQDDSLLTWSPAAFLQHYAWDFVSSQFQQLTDTECHVLIWRNRQDHVLYRTLEGVDLMLLQHFSQQNDTLNQILNQLHTLLPQQNIDDTVRNCIQKWFDEGVLLALSK